MLCDCSGLAVLTVKDPSPYPRAASFPVPSDQVPGRASHLVTDFALGTNRETNSEVGNVQTCRDCPQHSPGTHLRLLSVSFVEEALHS